MSKSGATIVSREPYEWVWVQLRVVGVKILSTGLYLPFQDLNMPVIELMMIIFLPALCYFLLTYYSQLCSQCVFILPCRASKLKRQDFKGERKNMRITHFLFHG